MYIEIEKKYVQQAFVLCAPTFYYLSLTFISPLSLPYPQSFICLFCLSNSLFSRFVQTSSTPLYFLSLLFLCGCFFSSVKHVQANCYVVGLIDGPSMTKILSASVCKFLSRSIVNTPPSLSLSLSLSPPLFSNSFLQLRSLTRCLP